MSISATNIVGRLREIESILVNNNHDNNSLQLSCESGRRKDRKSIYDKWPLKFSGNGP